MYLIFFFFAFNEENFNYLLRLPCVKKYERHFFALLEIGEAHILFL